LVALVVLSTAGVASSGPPRTRLRDFDCEHALDPGGRSVSVTAVMRPLAGTVKMALRFDLWSKSTGASKYAPVSGGDLGSWISPKDPKLGQRPGDVWILQKNVLDLAAPATYRLVVSFRWTGAHDRVLGAVARTSQRCYQPELRPDLLVKSIQINSIAGKPAQNAYVAVIGNHGATAAGQFEVLFAPGGPYSVKTRLVPQLGPHATIRERFVGPACTPSTAPTVTVDPQNQVDDYNRANNSLTATCPVPTGP
jgi:hypothetical protein